MIRSRHVFKALGLCAVVLGLAVFSAGAAQAEKGSHWNINKMQLEAGIQAKLENSHGILLSKFLGVPFNILCTAVELEEATLKAEGKFLGRIKYKGCKILKGSEVLAPCEPHTGAEKGVILTRKLKGLIVLDEDQPVALLTEDETPVGAQPTFVVIETSESCAFGAKIPIIGEFVVQDTQREGKVEKLIHLVTELASMTQLFVVSLTPEHKATIAGSFETFLTGVPHEGAFWSATPA